MQRLQAFPYELMPIGEPQRGMRRFARSYRFVYNKARALQERSLSKSAAGNSDAAGKNVRAASGLSKSILDQNWFAFRRRLDDKLAWGDGYLIAA